MIDENKLIEELKKRVKTPRSTMEIIKDIIPLIEEQPKVDEWIPCSERLPDTQTRVLAKIKHHEWITDYDNYWVPEDERTFHAAYTEVCEARYFGGDIGFEYYCTEEDYTDRAYVAPEEDISFPVCEVIAWIPLPEPYTGKE